MTAPILIVDDEAAIRRLVRGALERAGQSCEEAPTAAEAEAKSKKATWKSSGDTGVPKSFTKESIPTMTTPAEQAMSYRVFQGSKLEIPAVGEQKVAA